MSRETRKYGLFEKQSDGAWKQLSAIGLKKSSAVRFWQSALLSSAMGLREGGELRLRPVKEAK